MRTFLRNGGSTSHDFLFIYCLFMLFATENDAILEFKQRVLNSNVTKIEGMRFCDEQITL